MWSTALFFFLNSTKKKLDQTRRTPRSLLNIWSMDSRLRELYEHGRNWFLISQVCLLTLSAAVVWINHEKYGDMQTACVISLASHVAFGTMNFGIVAVGMLVPFSPEGCRSLCRRFWLLLCMASFVMAILYFSYRELVWMSCLDFPTIYAVLNAQAVIVSAYCGWLVFIEPFGIMQTTHHL